MFDYSTSELKVFQFILHIQVSYSNSWPVLFWVSSMKIHYVCFILIYLSTRGTLLHFKVHKFPSFFSLLAIWISRTPKTYVQCCASTGARAPASPLCAAPPCSARATCPAGAPTTPGQGASTCDQETMLLLQGNHAASLQIWWCQDRGEDEPWGLLSALQGNYITNSVLSTSLKSF